MNERQTKMLRSLEQLAQSLFDGGRTGDAQLVLAAAGELVRLARLVIEPTPLLDK